MGKDVVEVAKDIRKALKKEFPYTKFSVRSERYSGGSSINVSWTDFPTSSIVKKFVDQFSRVHRCEVTGEILSGGNMFVFAQNEYTKETKEKIENHMNQNYGEEYLDDHFGNMRAFNESAEELYNEWLSEKQPQKKPTNNNTTTNTTTEAPATKKQRYALHMASNRTIDTRNIEITKTEASELISKSMQGEDIIDELNAIINGVETPEVNKETETPEAINPQTEEEKEAERTAEIINEQSTLIVTETLKLNRYNEASTEQKEAHKYLLKHYIKSNELTINQFVLDKLIENVKETVESFIVSTGQTNTHNNEIESTEAPQENETIQTDKPQLEKIVFNWSESPVIADNTTIKTFIQANNIIKSAALNAPNDGTYNKTKFTIHYTDGQTYTGRFDIQYKDSFNGSITEHVKGFVTHMINNSEQPEDWKHFLNTYPLQDEQTKQEASHTEQKGIVLNVADRFKKRQKDNELNTMINTWKNDIDPYITHEERMELMNNSNDKEAFGKVLSRILTNTAVKKAVENIKEN